MERRLADVVLPLMRRKVRLSFITLTTQVGRFPNRSRSRRMPQQNGQAEDLDSAVRVDGFRRLCIFGRFLTRRGRRRLKDLKGHREAGAKTMRFAQTP